MGIADAFDSALERIAQEAGPQARDDCRRLIQDTVHEAGHGDLPRWLEALERIRAFSERSLFTRTDAQLDQAQVGAPAELDPECSDALKQALMVLHPWRKGPYRVGDLHLDTEWRSDWKWDRLGLADDSLLNARVLDVGCGNGYHGWRMLGAGARLVVGIDPTLLFAMQFAAIWSFMRSDAFCYLPIGIERMPSSLAPFDAVFSMGILYHRRSPIDHLQQLGQLLEPGGLLVLETLVIPGSGALLTPESRYARMRNVWCLPSTDVLCTWLQRLGFVDIRLIDVSQTGTDEQRSTDWMTFESLAQCLDPEDPAKTIEGHPAPLRAVIHARWRG